ncbi:hypothetical protein [Nonomuraea turcica]|uniref:hypothetical protein n=1 Tax=Nonomuraea sp. G32 TaxID=3067274 RepID=UPI00273B6EA3|nr:hypothetical protein [Nonomuraea sp. G32]MDP4501094.1 hypothetical protein [Nonomuraea sp. G32]
MKNGDRVVVRREFDPPHPTTGNRTAEWSGRLIDPTEHGFELDGDDGRRHGYFAANPGPGVRQTIIPLD